jgi:hypothetical protein
MVHRLYLAKPAIQMSSHQYVLCAGDSRLHTEKEKHMRIILVGKLLENDNWKTKTKDNIKMDFSKIGYQKVKWRQLSDDRF